MALRCDLCPKSCLIQPGQSGDCRIRVNIDDEQITAVTYGHPCAVNVDPVEKKPLFHFLPGTPILSLATVGCNLHCRNCQNWQISQQSPENSNAYKLLPADLPSLARKHNCNSIAYTYTEPLVSYEYTLDCCIEAHKAGLKNVLVTAGYINPEPLKKLLPYVDAANIDLKALSNDFYRDVCGATLQPVLNTLVQAKSEGVLVEVTNLLISTLNDSPRMVEDLITWVKDNMGRETPIHFSRFFPNYTMKSLPATAPETMDMAWNMARDAGMQFVYQGNIQHKNGENTNCPKCSHQLVVRDRYTILRNDIKNGACPKCSTPVYGCWQ